MKWVVGAFLVWSSAALPLAQAAHGNVEVRVRLRKGLKVVDVSGFAMRITSPSNLQSVEAPPMGLAQAKIRKSRKGLWLVQWDGQSQGRKTERIESEQLWVRGQMLRLGADSVPYALQLNDNEAGGVDVIAHLDLDTYLLGVLPSEMPAEWPLDALKAQAVAARSYVLRNAFERRDKDFDVDSTVIDQVYKFLSESALHPDWSAKVQRAVRETRGEVLVDSRHRILKAFYSADCGCTTEDPQFVWGAIEALKSVRDPSCQTHSTSTWAFQLDRADVRSSLITAFDLPTTTLLRALHVRGRTPSGRVAQVVAVIEREGQRQTLDLSAQNFRRVFGFSKIRSADFSLRWLGDKLEVQGRGIGHGVGLCQTGARAQAQSGVKYREILKLYYPKAQLWTLHRT